MTHLFSILYQGVRFLAIEVMSALTWISGKSEDLESVEQWGDIQLRYLYQRFPVLFRYQIPAGIGVTVHGLRFASPLTVAAFKADPVILEAWMAMGLGGGCIKTICIKARQGNPRPRLQDITHEKRGALLNALGLPGPGIEAYLAQLEHSDLIGLANLEHAFPRPIGFSLGGDYEDEYWAVFEQINTWVQGRSLAYYFELNISCPNTHTGTSLATDLEALHTLLMKMRVKTSAVISVKCAPDQDNLTQLAEKIHRIPKLIFNLGNTQRKKVTDLYLSDRQMMSMEYAGLSGAPLFERTLEMVKEVAPFGVPIMATGGISTIEQVMALKAAGAVLFGMATAIVKDMSVIPRLNQELKQRCHD